MQRSYCREGKKMILHEVLSPGPSHSYRPLDPGHGPICISAFGIQMKASDPLELDDVSCHVGAIELRCYGRATTALNP